MRCPYCHGAGWLPPKNDKRPIHVRALFVKCSCKDGEVLDTAIKKLKDKLTEVVNGKDR